MTNHYRRKAFKIRSSDSADEADVARRARSIESIILFLWLVVMTGAFGFGMYTLAVEAKTRLQVLFVAPLP